MAVTFQPYNSFLENLGTEEFDMDSDTFACTLHNNYTHAATHSQFSNVTDVAAELSATNNYTQGTALSTVTWGQTGGTVVMQADNVSWTASGGTIGPATDAVVYNDTSTTPDNQLVFSIDFGASESANDGADFNINWNASGLFTGAFS